MQNQDMKMALSNDAKPRLKWTLELHQRFINAVTELGGPEKATPKCLMRVMGIHGLTLYHLKSHLQKYRMGKSQQSQASIDDNSQEEYQENQRSDLFSYYSDESKNQYTGSLQMIQALQMQMEVQRKLHEQIEVQRHLQLRIEAQGKYLQSVLKKAQHTLAGYSSSSGEVEIAKAELSQLVSMVDNGCPNIKDTENNPFKSTICSLESSLTSLESSGGMEETQRITENDHNTDKKDGNSSVLSLMEMSSERKRSGSTISDANCVEQRSSKRSQQKNGLLESLDLNQQHMNELDWVPKQIDLN